MASLLWHRHKGIPSPGQGPAHLLTPCLAPRHTHIHTQSRLRSRRRSSSTPERKNEGTVKFNFTAWRWRSWVRLDELETEGTSTDSVISGGCCIICLFSKDGGFYYDFVIYKNRAIFSLFRNFLSNWHLRKKLLRNFCCLLIEQMFAETLQTSCCSYVLRDQHWNIASLCGLPLWTSFITKVRCK